MKGQAILAWSLLTALFAAGCTVPTADRDLSFPAPFQAEQAIVIAILDSGLTPYIELFQVPDDAALVARVPIPTRSVKFEAPDPSTDPTERDAAQWATLEPEVLYHFSGTRLFGISLGTVEGVPYLLDPRDHGSGTSYLAAREAPKAIIVVVQISGQNCLPETTCLLSPTIADGMEWIAAQDWIDIASVSLGVPGNAPDQGQVHAEAERFAKASKAAASRGMIVVNAAGNEITPSLGDYFNGPPHVISVGGFEFNDTGESVLASKGVDVVSNFTEWVPDARGKFAKSSGTSLATPIVAGTLADAMARIRSVDPTRNTTAAELRGAMNASAVHVGPADWDPKVSTSDLNEIFVRRSIPVVAQAQMGWGYVNGALAPEIARRVLEGDLAIPGEKAQAAAVQPAWQRTREEYWAKAG